MDEIAEFLNLKDDSGQLHRRFQYTAIDDATKILVLKIYDKHTEANAIYFVDYVVAKFPFRIHTVRTDKGNEFQTKFHWHVEDLGIRHSYIKVRKPRLNGIVERAHATGAQEFYQLLTYTDDVDLNAKLVEWENFYNFFATASVIKRQDALRNSAGEVTIKSRQSRF